MISLTGHLQTLVAFAMPEVHSLSLGFGVPRVPLLPHIPGVPQVPLVLEVPLVTQIPIFS